MVPPRQQRSTPLRKEGTGGRCCREDDLSIGGYMTLKAENYDAVLDLCNDCPTFEIGGKLEIREITEM